MRRPRSETSGFFRERTLDVYLLARTPWESVLAFQQRLVFELSEAPRDRAALILCDHPPIVTVGRRGSYRNIRMDASAIATGQVAVKWTNRGGGCWHQQPGQLAAYPIVPLCPRRFPLPAYRDALYRTLLDVLEEFRIPATADRALHGVRAGERPIASVGVAVKDWVAYHGCSINVAAPVDAPPLVAAGADVWIRPTSMFRELRAPVRLDAVRESFLRHFRRVLGFGRYYLLSPPANAFPEARPAHVRVANT
jgi:lipoyl(octanoyl) transferase